MHWWIVAVVVILFATAFYFRQRWLGPWQKLEELVGQVARGQPPRTFLVSGNRHAWRIGVALEDLLNRQQQLDQKASQESAEISAVFAALTDALVVLDAGQRVRFCNPAFEQLFGRVATGAFIGEIVRDADISETIIFSSWPCRSCAAAKKPEAWSRFSTTSLDSNKPMKSGAILSRTFRTNCARLFPSFAAISKLCWKTKILVATKAGTFIRP